MVKKIFRKIGDSAGIIFNSEERQILDIKPGDIVEVTIRKIIEVYK